MQGYGVPRLLTLDARGAVSDLPDIRMQVLIGSAGQIQSVGDAIPATGIGRPQTTIRESRQVSVERRPAWDDLLVCTSRVSKYISMLGLHFVGKKGASKVCEYKATNEVLSSAGTLQRHSPHFGLRPCSPEPIRVWIWIGRFEEKDRSMGSLK